MAGIHRPRWRACWIRRVLMTTARCWVSRCSSGCRCSILRASACWAMPQTPATPAPPRGPTWTACSSACAASAAGRRSTTSAGARYSSTRKGRCSARRWRPCCWRWVARCCCARTGARSSSRCAATTRACWKARPSAAPSWTTHRSGCACCGATMALYCWTTPSPAAGWARTITQAAGMAPGGKACWPLAAPPSATDWPTPRLRTATCW